MIEPVVLLFPQPEKVPSENVQRSAARSPNRGAAIGVSKQLAEWQDAAFFAWKQQRGRSIALPACNVCVELQFRMRRTRDPHNYIGTIVKSIIDGLIYAHAWPDDNPAYITILEPILTVVDTSEREALTCTVHITPREP